MRGVRRLESKLQALIIMECRKRKIFARKVTSPGRKGFPDVLIIHDEAVVSKFGSALCKGPCLFVELKRFIVHQPDSLQALTHREMDRAGARVLTLRGEESVRHFLGVLFGENP